jgi:microsomal dipeptidase-like Zn-dependent dipeptidase
MTPDEILELHRAAPLIDLHVHQPLKLFLFEHFKLYEDHQVEDRNSPFEMTSDLPSLVGGGVRVALATTHIPEPQLEDDCLVVRVVSLSNHQASLLFKGPADDMTRAMMERFEGAVADSQSRFDVAMCKDRQNLETALSAGKIAFCHAVEGSHSLLGPTSILDNLNDLFERGVCMLTLAHFYDHGIAPPSPGMPSDTFLPSIGCFQNALNVDPSLPLHPSGETVVRWMLEHGMLVDLSHLTPAARADVFRIWNDVAPASKRPLAISHVGLREMASLPMNPTWDELDLLRRTDGVVGIIFMNYWLTGHTQQGAADTLQFAAETVRLLIKNGFENNISIGSDFDGFTEPPADLKEPSDIPALTDELLTCRRFGGVPLTEAQMSKLLGGNALRVLRAAWGR